MSATCPDGKLVYAAAAAARKAANVLRKGRGSRRGAKRASKVYRCQHESCRGWHLASAEMPAWKRAQPQQTRRFDAWSEVDGW